MLSPIHISFNLLLLSIIAYVKILNVSIIDLILLLSSEFIDLDHFFSRPVYHPKRNPFKTHFLHKKWLSIIIISLGLISFRPTTFLGIGLLSHLFLDWIYIKINKIK